MRDRIIMLQESAEELGFGTIQQALDAGYHEVQDLVNNTFKLEKVEDLTNRAYRETHEAWEKEKARLLNILRGVQEDIAEWLDNKDHPDIKAINEVITFMEDYCHD